MGAMSRLHVLAQEVQNRVDDGEGVREALVSVAEQSSMSLDEIEWAYRELKELDKL